MIQRKSPSTRIRVDFSDSTGAKYSVNIESPSKDNLVKLIEFVNSMSSNNSHEESIETVDTNFGRVYGLLETKFKFAAFTSADVLNAYEHEFNTPSSLSIISTYLARLTNRGVLTRFRSGQGWTYRIPERNENTNHNAPPPTEKTTTLIPP